MTRFSRPAMRSKGAAKNLQQSLDLWERNAGMLLLRIPSEPVVPWGLGVVLVLFGGKIDSLLSTYKLSLGWGGFSIIESLQLSSVPFSWKTARASHEFSQFKIRVVSCLRRIPWNAIVLACTGRFSSLNCYLNRDNFLYWNTCHLTMRIKTAQFDKQKLYKAWPFGMNLYIPPVIIIIEDL